MHPGTLAYAERVQVDETPLEQFNETELRPKPQFSNRKAL